MNQLEQFESINSDPYAVTCAQLTVKAICQSLELDTIELESLIPLESSDESSLLAMMEDSDSTEVGVVGPFAHQDRLFLYHRRFQSAAYAGLTELLNRKSTALPDDLIQRMISLVCQTRFVCGVDAESFSFSEDQWKHAIEFSGGFDLAEPLLRKARQQMYEASRSEEDDEANPEFYSSSIGEFTMVLDLYSGLNGLDPASC